MSIIKIIESIKALPDIEKLIIILFSISMSIMMFEIIRYVIDFVKGICNYIKAFYSYGKRIIARIRGNKKYYDIHLTPMQAGFLLSRWITFNHIVATILHFLNKGILSLEKFRRKDGTFAYRLAKKELEFCNYGMYSLEFITDEKINKLKEKQITLSEIYVIDKIVFKYYTNINADRIFELYDNYDDYSKLYKLRPINERKELQDDLFRARAIILQELNEKYGEFGENYKNPKAFYYPSMIYEYKVKDIRKYKRKLLYDTLLSERSIENVHLWGEHLIYGVALGVCKTSIKDAIEIYKGKRTV